MLPESFTPEYLAQIELFKIRARKSFLGSRQGGHISPKRGHGIEFSDYRKYELGDNPRHIDWGVYARSDRLYVKRFQEEQDLSVLVIVDCSASMHVPAEDKKWELARDITLSIAYVALMSHDSVFVSALGNFHSPNYYGGKSIHSLAKLLLEAQPSEDFALLRDVQRAASKVRFPGVAVFVSDFLMPAPEIEAAFNILRSKNLDVTAIQVLSPTDIEPLPADSTVLAADSETGEQLEVSLSLNERQEYGMLLVQHNERLKRYLRDARIPYALALSTKGLAQFVQEDLSLTGLLG